MNIRPPAPRIARIKQFDDSGKRLEGTRIDTDALKGQTDTLVPLAEALNRLGINLPQALKNLDHLSGPGAEATNLLLAALNYGSPVAELRIQLDTLVAFVDRSANKLKGEAATQAPVPQADSSRTGY